MVGVEYDQRNQSGYTVNPIGLWERMRNLTNSHLQTFDTANPILIAGTGGGLDQRYYRYVYNATLQNQIDKSLRESLGLSADNQSKLFSEFSQIEAKCLQGGGGYGLGMWIWLSVFILAFNV